MLPFAVSTALSAVLCAALAPLLPGLLPSSVYVALFSGTFCLLFYRKYYVPATGVLLLCWLWWSNESAVVLPDSLAGVETELTGQIVSTQVVSAQVVSTKAMASDVLRLVFAPDTEFIAAGWPERIQLSWYFTGAGPQGGHQPDDQSDHQPDHQIALHAGDRWRLLVKARPPRSLVNPGGNDRAKQAYLAGVGALGYVRASPRNQLLTAARPSVLQQLRE